MQSDLTTGVGLQNSGVVGVVIGGPVKQGKKTWWLVDFANGADGWVFGDLLTVDGNVPTVQLTAAPATISPGGSTTLDLVQRKRHELHRYRKPEFLRHKECQWHCDPVARPDDRFYPHMLEQRRQRKRADDRHCRHAERHHLQRRPSAHCRRRNGDVTLDRNGRLRLYGKR